MLSKIGTYMLLIVAATIIQTHTLEAQIESLQKRSLTVHDVIEMRSIIDPFHPATIYGPAKFQFSPDFHHFLLVTQTRNLKTGYNDAELWLFHSKKVLEFINKKGKHALPEAEIVARFSSSSNRAAIRQLQWLADGNSIAFIAESPGNLSQVFQLNISSGELIQLTQHPRSVLYFSLSDTANTLVFLSTHISKNQDWENPSFIVGTRTLSQVMSRDQPYPSHITTELQYYSKSLHQGASTQPLMHSFVTGKEFTAFRSYDIWISPDGQKAALHVPATFERQMDWIGDFHPISNSSTYKSIANDFDENVEPKIGFLFCQFAIVNLADGTLEKLIDAPIGHMLGGLNAKAVWHPNSQIVFLSNTFLPLKDVGAEEREIRRRAPAIAAYNLATAQVKRLVEMEVPDGGTQSTLQVTDIKFGTNTNLITSWSTTNGVAAPDRVYRAVRKDWVEVYNNEREPIRNHNRENPLKLSINENLNTPPNLLAEDVATGNKKLITNLNPQFEALTFGRIETFDWIGLEKRLVSGGLVYPTNYNIKKRYPLVIQVGYFLPERFLISGPITGLTTSAYAAQALANQDIMVLLVNDSPKLGKHKEILATRIEIEAAIQKLDQMALIDTDKMGLVGFSRTGFFVQDLITFSEYNFTAAVVADASNLSRYSLSVYHGRPLGIQDMENLMGARPFGNSRVKWIQKDPNLHLDNIKTALRIESNGPEIPLWWGAYTMLRRMNKPVELVIYPRGEHNLKKPFEQLSSQQGTVDWLAFWLKNEENPDRAKAEQYDRWRKMLPQQALSISAAALARGDAMRTQ
ncbi:MAG: hypothetical protein JKY34_07825 [Kordiimonadaceae bacterium]|nr:hypothetical protein [Kordiimonadaceae bacterium]